MDRCAGLTNIRIVFQVPVGGGIEKLNFAKCRPFVSGRKVVLVKISSSLRSCFPVINWKRTISNSCFCKVLKRLSPPLNLRFLTMQPYFQ